MKQPPKVKALLIDPFQMEILPVTLTQDSSREAATLLDCDSVQAVALGITARDRQHLAWVDEQGLLREPFVYPHWVCAHANGGHPMAGYGLITGISPEGKMLDCQIPMEILVPQIGFEPWRSRISIDHVIPQMLRVYTLAK